MRKLKFILVLLIAPFFLNLTYANPIILHGDKASSKVKHAIYVRYNDRSPLPQLIRFDPSNPLQGYEFSTWLNQFFKKGVKPGFNLIKVRRDQYGYVHKKYQEIVNGYPVQYGVIQAHIRNGYVSTYSGELYPTNVNTTSASLSESKALSKALAYMNASVYKWQIPGAEQHIKDIKNDPNATFYPKGKLVYIYKDNKPSEQFRLAYHFDIYAAKPLGRKEVWIDAQTGEVLFTNNEIHDANEVGTAQTLYSGTQSITTDKVSANNYRLSETNRAGGANIHTYNMNHGTNYNNRQDITNSNNTSWSNEAGLDAHWGAEQVIDFYWQKFNRNSLDGNGMTINSYVHYDNGLQNAFWDGYEMSYGDGSGNNQPFTALDITGHEMTHGVVQHTSGFTGSGEAGALNESFADCFGNTVEHFAKPSSANWGIGEDLFPPSGIRNMANPRSQGKPDTYLGSYWNNGGGDVHYRACPHDYYYYLVVEGGSGTNHLTNPDTYNVTGIGWDKAIRIAYRSLSVYLTPNTTYSDARAGAIQSAIDLYGACSQAVITVTNAYYAIGVGNQYSGGAVVSNFVGSPTSSCSVPFTVTFTNTGSTGSGNTYSWDFGDGGTSTSENPTHTYTNFGQYDVALTTTPSSQSCGSDNETKTNYIDANAANSCFSCDTINYPLPGTLAAPTAQAGGYVAGWNGYGDIAKANEFTNYGTYTHVTGALLGFYGVYDNGDGAQVEINVWGDNNGSPGAKLKTITVSLQDLESSLTLAGGTHQGVVQVTFPEPVAVSSPYYLGITMVGFTANDSLGLISNTDGDSPTDMMWEQESNNSWGKYSADWGGNSLDLYVSPIMTETPPDAVVASNHTTICAGTTIHYDGTGSQNVEEGGYLWEFPGGNVATSTDSILTVSYATAGTYNAILHVLGGCSGMDSDTIPIVVNPSPTIAISSTTDPTVCGGNGTINLTLTGVSDGTYTISYDNGSFANVTVSGGTASITAAGGNYNNMKISASGCGSTNGVSATITDPGSPSQPSVNIGSATCSANGSATISNYNSANTYTFSPSGPSVGSGGVISNATTGTNYSVTVSAGSCSSSAESFTVPAQLPAPSAPTVNTNPATCSADGTAAISNYSSSNTYTFSPSGPTIGFGGAISGATAGTNYSVTSSSSGCTSSAGNFNVPTQLPAPLITVNSTTPPTVCGGNGDIHLTFTGVSDGNYTINYDGGTFTNVIVSGGTATISTPAGSYNNITVNNGSCTSVNGVNASFSDPSAPAEPTVSTAAATCSTDGSATISNYNSGNTYTFSPTGPTINSSGDITGANLGTSYTVISSTGTCNSSSATFTVASQLPTPTVSASATDNSICVGEYTSLSASGADTYAWDNGLGAGSSQNVNPSTTTTYQVTGTSSNGCTATDQVTVTVTPGITVSINASQTTICDGTPATLTASGANTYSWDNGLGSGATQSVNPSATTTYNVTGTSSGCTNQASITITVGQMPDVQVTPVNVSICEGESTTLLATGADSYTWTPSSSLNTATGSSVIASPVTNTTYQVTGTNNCGTDVSSISVTVNAAPTVPTITQNGNVLSVTLASGETAKWYHNSSLVGNGAQYTITETGDYKVVIINGNGCTAQATGTFQTDDAGLATNNLKQLNIYPNPTNGMLTIDWGTIKGVQKIRVYDMIGKEVFVAPASNNANKQSINLSRFEKGIYVIRLVTKENTISRKITKQ